MDQTTQRVVLPALFQERLRMVSEIVEKGKSSDSNKQILMKNKAYTILMALQLTSIGIKYGGSDTNPFQHSAPTVLLFLTAACCHVLASTAETNWQTIFIFNVSGVVGCEALMWILIAPEFLWWYIINVPLLLVSFYFNYNRINKLLPDTTLLLVTLCFNYNQITDLIRGRIHDPNFASRGSLCV